ncbi:MAG TPA: hypothetical protein VN873_19120, partial [Candidatus Angelobacter sp.]|nr:hypothetical protein [Candidatus Angelobacter sp.]
MAAGIILTAPNFVDSYFSPLKQVVIDNGGNRGAITPWTVTGTTLNALITGGAVVSNTMTQPQFGNLTIGSNSTLRLASSAPTLSISIFTNLIVQAGGLISAEGLNISGQGAGQTLNSTGGGGAGAGFGGNSASNAMGGIAFSDSLTQPMNAGSRGGSGFNQGLGGNGGGSLRMTVGRLLRLDGRISADGAPGPALNSGGGGGGTLNISVLGGFAGGLSVTGGLSGSGTFSANGGAGNALGGGGGGGHIAVIYGSNTFTGTFTAHGGGGANAGGAGTIYVSRGQADGFGLPPQQIIIDNAGQVGAVTPLFNGTTLSQVLSLSITGGAIASNVTFTTPSCGNLLLGSNSTWMVVGSGAGISRNFTVLSNATIQAGGRLTVDGSTSRGPAMGQTLNGTGGGGGHAGYGGASILNALGGNVILDSANEPNGTGSQGGDNGGFGGGALQFTVRGTLQLDGKISADGLGGLPVNSGGGSGGSVWLTAGKLSGTGAISANGGAGNNGGGGGGGGRVAISSNTNLFTGSITARGGAGTHFGGAGTIYLSASAGLSKTSQLIVDNGGAHGTNTFINGTGVASDVLITNGASVTVPGANQTMWNSLTIASGSSLGLNFNSLSATISVFSNLTVQAGGSLALDGQGYAANLGQGRGSASGGGAGHGGYGGPGSNLSAPAGISYDLIENPSQAGSGGGGAPNISGSAGGGALHLLVNGILTDNGIISANGQPGTAPGAGGGAGGSLWLSVGRFAGAGKILADGGNGEMFGGGGGGAGGRIAIDFNSNQFTGTISAHGGTGPSLAGGAGTIYLVPTNSFIGLVPPGTLILDNNGVPGTNTSLDSLPLEAPILSIANGAAASASKSLTLESLSVHAGGVFNPDQEVPLRLNVLGNALIDAGGAINANGLGESTRIGTSTGNVDYFGDGSGGGYGGAGGASLFGAPGGAAFGFSNAPTSLGSQGGISPQLPGFSQGGGAVQLTINGALTVNGLISANGNDGFIAGSGGGSGGSIWITSGSLLGEGAITANGGAGESDEGGGGGGG